MLLGEILQKNYSVKEEDINKALSLQKEIGGLIGQILIQIGAITETQLIYALSEQLGLPVFESYNEDSLFETITFLENKGGIDYLLKKNIVPFDIDHKKRIVYVLLNTFDLTAFSELSKATQYTVKPVLGYEKDIRELKSRFNIQSGDNLISLESEKSEIDKLKDMAFETPVIKYLNEIINRAVESNASDIHIEPYEGRYEVRFRIDGVLHVIDELKEGFYLALVSRIKLLSSLDIAERRLPQDGKFSTRVGSTIIDVRTSTIPSIKGEDVVIRLLYRSKLSFDIKSLGIMNDHLEILLNSIQKTYGMVLITGPTGSGKTTTLYSLLSLLRSPEKKIITVEDPVEYQIDGLNQIQVKPDIGFDFSNALRSILRHDPDIIMVGEVRDKETAEIAIQSALTGHLIFSTLHTNDAPSALFRLLDMGIDDYLINASVECIVAQRIIRQNCPYCLEEFDYSDELKNKWKLNSLFEKFGNIIHEMKFMKGKGCQKCLGTGFRGRKAIYEIFNFDEELKEIFIKEKSLGKVKDYLANLPYYRSLKEDGFLKVLQGITTVEEVLRVAL